MMTPSDSNYENRSSLYEDYHTTSDPSSPISQPVASSNPFGSSDNLPSAPVQSSRSASPVPPERISTPPPNVGLPVMSAHGNQHGKWAQDWEEVERKILMTHQKLSISVSSPEIISSMMSK